MSHIFLIGFMGAGKSTVGNILAGKMHVPLVDLDSMIEERVGRTVAQIFAEDGERRFRELEHEALSEVCSDSDAVVACGGGVVLRDENRALMRDCGTVVYLAVSAEEAVARIGDTSGRPLLAGDSARMARTILDARLSMYRATADHIVDTGGRNANEVADEILAAVSAPRAEAIRVGAGDGYQILVGVGVIQDVGSVVASSTGARKAALVVDETVDAILGAAVLERLESEGMVVARVVIPPGEASKSWAQAHEVLDRFAQAGLDRNSAVVALGGGVVGDLAGFCAATYMRGIPVVQVPTTLLAQVDSSIGGKTGVDLEAGKNLAGAFWQPAAVLTDTTVLQTLPDSEWHNGLVEVVKTALLQGEEDLARLERDAAHLNRRDEHAVRDMVLACARFKAGVVSDDERESGLRECLNLGHTLGHAIEKVAGYGTVSHGIAVAEGLRVALWLGERLEDASPQLRARIEGLLDALDVPRVGVKYVSADIKEAMLKDKKSRDSMVRFVLPLLPGEWIVRPVDQEVIDQALEWWSAERS